MSTILVELYDALKEAGTSEEKARAAAGAISGKTDLATKADLSELRTGLRAEMAELRTELRAEMTELRSELRAEMAELRSEMALLEQRLTGRITESQNSLIKWLVPVLIGQAAAIVALIKLLPG